MRELGDRAGGILSYFTRHATAANLLLVVLILAGLASFPRMRAQFFPDVIVDNVTVSVAWEGAGAEDVDAAIVQVLEPAMLAVEGVEQTNSRSVEGTARITLDFEPGWDMGRAAEDVQAAVDAVTTLPEDAEEAVVRRGRWRSGSPSIPGRPRTHGWVSVQPVMHTTAPQRMQKVKTSTHRVQPQHW